MWGLDEIKTLPAGGRGVALQALEARERLVAALPITASGVVVIGTLGGKERRVELSGAALAAHFGKRARKGKILDARLKEIKGLARPDGTAKP